MVLRELNAAIDDEDFSIGPSYFMTGDGSLPNLERSGRTRSCRSCESAITARARISSASEDSLRSESVSKPMRIDLAAWSEQLEYLPAEVAISLPDAA